MQAILEQQNVWETEKSNQEGLQINNVQTDKKRVGIIAGLFGCWHKQLSRPFTTHRDSYRVCVHCGARRGFNPKTLQTHGAFYFPVETKIKSE